MKKKVAAYARVSTSSKSQEHSFDFQSNYWNETLGNDPNYEYVGLYADKGISGKSAIRRPQFMLLMNKAREQEVDIIFTKSVQRFARNTTELLMYVHELRELGIPVIFEKEKINSLSADSDLYLTIAAAVAEDDLSRYSQNVVWSVREKYKRGEPSSLGGRIYGFYVGKNASLEVNPDEAKIVNEIFEMYVNGKSLEGIAKELNDSKVPAPASKVWSKSTIRGIIGNEKYIGDLLLQKSYCIKGYKKLNKGELDSYYVENHHEPIISKELWDKCQQVINAKANPKLVGLIQKRYPFTSLIECSCCHKSLVHKFNHSSFKHPQGMWRCSSTRSVCDSTAIRDDILEELFIEAYNEFVTKKYKGEEESDLQEKIDKLSNQQKELTRLHVNGWIPTNEFHKEFDDLMTQIKNLVDQQDLIKFREIKDTDFKPITTFDEKKVEKFIYKCVVKKQTIEFHFYNGVVIKKQVINRRIYHR